MAIRGADRAKLSVRRSGVGPLRAGFPGTHQPLRRRGKWRVGVGGCTGCETVRLPVVRCSGKSVRVADRAGQPHCNVFARDATTLVMPTRRPLVGAEHDQTGLCSWPRATRSRPRADDIEAPARIATTAPIRRPPAASVPQDSETPYLDILSSRVVISVSLLSGVCCESAVGYQRRPRIPRRDPTCFRSRPVGGQLAVELDERAVEVEKGAEESLRRVAACDALPGQAPARLSDRLARCADRFRVGGSFDAGRGRDRLRMRGLWRAARRGTAGQLGARRVGCGPGR
jgi:hypothetical protein